MAISLVGTIQTVSTASTSASVNKPTGVASGDLLLIGITTLDGGTASTPSGFATCFTQVTGPGIRNCWYWRVADGTEGSTFTVEAPDGQWMDAHCGAYRGVDTGTPFNLTSAATASSGASITTPNLGSTTRDGCWHILGFHSYNFNSTGNPPSGYTEDVAYDTNSQHVDHKLITTAGATGAQTITAGGGQTGHIAVAIAIQPPAGGATVEATMSGALGGLTGAVTATTFTVIEATASGPLGGLVGTIAATVSSPATGLAPRMRRG